jgi:hypothetical protein
MKPIETFIFIVALIVMLALSLENSSQWDRIKKTEKYISTLQDCVHTLQKKELERMENGFNFSEQSTYRGKL